MRKTISFATLALATSTCFAQTPDVVAEVTRLLEGTTYVLPHIESADGMMTACGLEFSVLKRDFATKAGAPVKIAGSFYLRGGKNGGLFYALKMGLGDGIGKDQKISAPANAFIRAPRGTAPTKAIRTEAENAGYALFVGAVDDNVVEAYEAIATQKQFVIGFNRAPGQMDVTSTVDLTVIDTQMIDGKVVREKSDRAVQEFMACTGNLFKTVQK